MGAPPAIAVSSRVSLARNCAEYPFSHRLAKAQAIRLLARAEPLFRAAGEGEGGPFLPGAGDGLRREFAAADGRAGCVVGGLDHFLMWGQTPGEALDDCLARARLVEAMLERQFPFAVSLEWGYLSPRLDKLGTAMRASLVLHAPALAAEADGELLAAALEGASDGGGLELAGWGPAGSRLVRIRNRETLGVAEGETTKRLAALGRLLLHYEQDLAAKRRRRDPAAFDDAAWRALGLLRACRLVAPPELLELLAVVRLGLNAGAFAAEGPAAGAVDRAIGLACAEGAGADPAALAERVRPIFAQ